MRNKKLDELLEKKIIKLYAYENIESEPNSGMHEYEKLIIVFNDNTILEISGQCSGVMENVSFFIE